MGLFRKDQFVEMPKGTTGKLFITSHRPPTGNVSEDVTHPNPELRFEILFDGDKIRVGDTQPLEPGEMSAVVRILARPYSELEIVNDSDLALDLYIDQPGYSEVSVQGIYGMLSATTSTTSALMLLDGSFRDVDVTLRDRAQMVIEQGVTAVSGVRDWTIRCTSPDQIKDWANLRPTVEVATPYVLSL